MWHVDRPVTDAAAGAHGLEAFAGVDLEFILCGGGVRTVRSAAAQ